MGMSISIVKHLGISNKTLEVKILVFSFLYFHPLPYHFFLINTLCTCMSTISCVLVAKQGQEK